MSATAHVPGTPTARLDALRVKAADHRAIAVSASHRGQRGVANFHLDRASAIERELRELAALEELGVRQLATELARHAIHRARRFVAGGGT